MIFREMTDSFRPQAALPGSQTQEDAPIHSHALGQDQEKTWRTGKFLGQLCSVQGISM